VTVVQVTVGTMGSPTRCSDTGSLAAEHT
jgi:hypothetical protein